ncbi:hypothetical protein ACFO25_14600 [Paenactinomyces guangxiensis]|nr:hypothetical protein [Paenactinomyces guangxiensis]
MIETFGDDDVEMEYFNEVLFILEMIAEDYNAILFDPQAGEFYN